MEEDIAENISPVFKIFIFEKFVVGQTRRIPNLIQVALLTYINRIHY